MNRRKFLISASAAGLATAGCASDQGAAALRVATEWTEAELWPIRQRYDGLSIDALRPPALSGLTIDWLRRVNADVLLGASPSFVERLRHEGMVSDLGSGNLAASDRGIPGTRFVLAFQQLPAISGTASWQSIARWDWMGQLVLGDIRHDQAFADALIATFADTDLATSYAHLVRFFSNARGLERSTRACLSVLQRGRGSGATICAENAAKAARVSYETVTPANSALQRCVVLKRASEAPAARKFLDAVSNSNATDATNGVPEPSASQSIESSRRDLLADEILRDLLESSLMVSHPELKNAAELLVRNSNVRPDACVRAAGFLVEPPPWPPASVRELLNKAPKGELIEALAEQVVTPASRRWLLESWRAEPKPLDHATLRAIAGLAQSDLQAQSVFRTWLRAEWTAWARQRYRRVARLASGEATA